MPLKKPTLIPGGAAVQPDGIEALRDHSPETRWAAARNFAGHPEAVAALDEALGKEPDKRVRSAIFTSLSAIANQESFEAALRYLRTDDAELRGEAMEAMKFMPDMMLKNLDAVLHDADVDVRILGCELARDLTSPQAARSLAQLLSCETTPNVCTAAIDVLAEIGGTDDIPDLEACAARFPAEPFLGFAVKTASMRIGSRSGAAGA